MKKRIVLTFPPTQVGQPITYHLVKDYDLMVNILRGVVTPKEEGKLVVELTGSKKNLDGALAYLKQIGVGTASLAHDIKWYEDKCTHCTACIPMCPTGAMQVDRATMNVSFIKDKCIACELCVGICPFQALDIQYRE